MNKILLLLIGLLIGMIAGGIIVGGMSLHIMVFLAKNKDANIMKFKSYFELALKMIEKLISGDELFQTLVQKKYNKLAIYGCGSMGRLLVKLLEREGIFVCFFIDKGLEGKNIDGKNVRGVNDIDTDVDCIIVTPYLDFENIENELKHLNEEREVLPLNLIV